MNMNVRVLVVAAICVLSGLAIPGVAAASPPTLHGLTAEAGSSGPVIHLRTDDALETVHYSPQPGVWVVEMPAAEWESSVGTLAEPSLGIERAELDEVDYRIVSATQRGLPLVSEPAEVLAASLGLPAGGVLEQGEAAQQGGLARAAGAAHGHDLAGREVQSESGQQAAPAGLDGEVARGEQDLGS